MGGIYIHVPFCKQACSYCDFYFITRQELMPAYVEALCREIELSASLHPFFIPESIYFGGGTPSQLSADNLHNVFKTLSRSFNLAAVQEITLEMNPDDVTETYLQHLFDLNVNRVSMGIQSFDEKLLQFMHRSHNSHEALESLQILSNSPIKNFTCDLIYGNPGQGIEAFIQDLNQLMSFNPPHISAYALTIEPKTRLSKSLQKGYFTPADEKMVNEHVDALCKITSQKGYQRYEVSNFCKQGYLALHNSSYWEHKPYLGFGPGAHSFDIDRDKRVGKRYQHPADIKAWLHNPMGIDGKLEILDEKQLAEEYIMLRLRTADGLDKEILLFQYGYEMSNRQIDFVEDLIRRGMLEESNQRVKFTHEGFKLTDYFTLELISR